MDENGIRKATPAREDIAVTELSLFLGAGLIGEFYQILLRGFGMTARLPCTVKNLLCFQFGLSPDYVEERITTVFLNGKATDDIDEASVGDEAIIALSAAMPGLVGATMRRGGYYASMRSAITHQEVAAGGTGRIATVRVKLFNLLLPELGPEFLRRGILLSEAEIGVFFGEREEAFWTGCGNVLLDGSPVAPGRLRDGDALACGGTVRLTVIFGDEELSLADE
jgi:hypothetical protein